MLATTEFDQLKCLKVALRLKPDRIVVGEVRDGAAALPLLKSWNTGHPGGDVYKRQVRAQRSKGAAARTSPPLQAESPWNEASFVLKNNQSRTT